MNDDTFAFEHLVFLSNRDLWLLLTETDNLTILRACQRADDAVLIRIRSVFSKTACEYFNDDLSKFWATSEEEAAEARRQIEATFRRLSRKGRFRDTAIRYAA